MVLEPEVVVWDHEVVVGDQGREVREGAFLAGNHALEVANQAGMGAEHDGGRVDLESVLGEEPAVVSRCAVATQDAAGPQ